MMENSWVLDFGNSRVKLVQFEHENLLSLWTDEEALEEAHRNPRLDSSALMLVAATGPINEQWAAWIDQSLQNAQGPRIIQLETAEDVPWAAAYDSPATLGLDRLANAAAAVALDAKSDWLVIDAGTCITVDFIHDGQFQGGSISPGIDLRLRAMYAGTASLPYPEDWRERSSAGVALHLGNDTESSLLAGAIGGVHAELAARIDAFNTEFPGIRIALTGGDAKFLELRSELTIFADPNLTWIGYHHLLNRIISHESAS